jgi:hypothetical protein
MTHRTRVRPAPGRAAATRRRPGQRATAIGLLAGVVVLDQTATWWAWRNVSRAIINAGRSWPVGRPVSGIAGAALLVPTAPAEATGHV